MRARFAALPPTWLAVLELISSNCKVRPGSFCSDIFARKVMTLDRTPATTFVRSK